ncbi:MAG: hypothetical protein F4120_10395 [Rhodothermaceae bacterium]|nr:hypothetical protein [Rhodothermaceae bacterium]MXW31668.1 hypothetical protein [Rhodothermaceae bacterium]MYC05400.1 hypothetical protein [Rhodothermaceae bacterium]MYE63079.1 hypothetical protein [Rhodothermaceae bacterium]MYI18008.1 hypothetical protein [Rhodothermaceae bacterium]
MEDCLQNVRPDNYPALACAGYIFGCGDDTLIEAHMFEKFIRCIDQQHDRSPGRQTELAGNSIALLGIADGLKSIETWGQTDSEQLEAAKNQVRELLEHRGEQDMSMRRVRLLASDLLNMQGRFGTSLTQSTDIREAAFDLCLWHGWPDVLRNVEQPNTDQRRELFTALLTEQTPDSGDLLHAVSWLCALEVLSSDFAAMVVPDKHDIVRILASTQGSFKRWRWEERGTRTGTAPTRWVIDKESDVQAFLLAVLYPFFRDQLRDEQYLQGFGLRQGRFDFAITSLGLIIEVKMMRKAGDINKIESEIADDLTLYFNDTSPFTNMIVYIYDDCDKPKSEKYPTICDALKKRSDRIIDVVVIPRPSMIPNRNERR